MTFNDFLSAAPARDYIFQDEDYDIQIERAAKMIKNADYVLVGAGAGLSTAAGAQYGGSFFEENFGEFISQMLSDEKANVVLLELGVGFNTPEIIKFVFHRLTKNIRLSTYICINYGEAYAPEEITDRSIVINADAGEVIKALLGHA